MDEDFVAMEKDYVKRLDEHDKKEDERRCGLCQQRMKDCHPACYRTYFCD